jgi:hypothetical protein
MQQTECNANEIGVQVWRESSRKRITAANVQLCKEKRYDFTFQRARVAASTPQQSHKNMSMVKSDSICVPCRQDTASYTHLHYVPRSKVNNTRANSSRLGIKWLHLMVRSASTCQICLPSSASPTYRPHSRGP